MRIFPNPRRLLLTLTLGYCFIVGFLWVKQRSLLYFPERDSEERSLKIAASFDLEPVRDGDGEVAGWRSLPNDPPAANRLIAFNGNAGFALHRTAYAEGLGGLDSGALWQVTLMDYPGYGARGGDPTHESITRAADDLLATLLAEDDRPIYLLGESLGSAVASELASRHPDKIKGLILITPFTAIVDVAKVHHPYVPVGWILKDRWDNAGPLSTGKWPIAVVLAGKDEVVTTKLGQQLYDGYSGRKRLWLEADAGHNDIAYYPDHPVWREFSDFLLGGKASGL